jgi:hypothetical protein
MSFQAAAYLRKATSRAKSDVANKLVSMFLHEVSRKLSSSLEFGVADPRYAESVVAKFGVNCCYCGKLLENDRAAVEHPDGMNRFRAGLHIPGNVILACKKCNNEKRRDDQLRELKLANSGWESFLSHDSKNCNAGCKTCLYWKNVWPDDGQRINKLRQAKNRISEFRSQYAHSILLNGKAQASLQKELEKIYRECQVFATTRIKGAVEQVVSSF